jgi:hypothetical protein
MDDYTRAPKPPPGPYPMLRRPLRYPPAPPPPHHPPQSTLPAPPASLLQAALALTNGQPTWVGAYRTGAGPGTSGWAWVDGDSPADNLNPEAGLWVGDAPRGGTATAAVLWQGGVYDATPTTPSPYLCQGQWTCPEGHHCATPGVKVRGPPPVPLVAWALGLCCVWGGAEW